MFNTDDIKNEDLSGSLDRYDLVSKWYPVFLASCSVRAQHVLQAYQKEFLSKTDFYDAILNLTYKDAKNLRNCGAKTVKEILELSKTLRFSIEGDVSYKIESQNVILPDNIDKILPVILNKAEELSNRAQHAIQLFISQQGNSVQLFYNEITAPTFSVYQIKNIGRGTAKEVELFFKGITEFINQFCDSSSVDSFIKKLAEPSFSNILIPEEYGEKIMSLKEQYGYFPIFAAASAYLAGLDEESKTIINGCIRIFIDQTIEDRRDVAHRLGFTPERVRQKRNGLIDKLKAFFEDLRRLGFVSANPYSFLMTHVEEYVNSTEETKFNANFVNWALDCTFPEVTMIGDIFKPFTNFYNSDLFVNIVPTELCQYFDFNAFVSALDEKLDEKRTDEERVNLKSFMSPFFKVRYYEDWEKDVETACRSILYLTYKLEVDMGQIIFQPNKRKNNSDIIEDILRSAGHPMTLDELYDEFTYQYPERSVMYESFRGNISNNSNVVPIGRSSTYALVEWQDGNYRGGTIREFVSEYLDSIPEHIATVEAVGNYVRQFRATSGDESIVANLSQDTSQKYAIYIREGQKFIGYKDYLYDLSFVLYDRERVLKRSVEVSLKLLIEFIEEHKHFPLNQPNEPEETRLYKFSDSMRSSFNRGVMNEEHVGMWREFCDKYEAYRLSRKFAEEIDFIKEKIHEYLNTIDWPYGFRSINEIIGQALDYYVLVFDECDKDEVIRPYLICGEVNNKPVGHHFLTYIIDRYVNTKHSKEWDGREWISEDVLRFFNYDDASLDKMIEEFRQAILEKKEN